MCLRLTYNSFSKKIRRSAKRKNDNVWGLIATFVLATIEPKVIKAIFVKLRFLKDKIQTAKAATKPNNIPKNKRPNLLKT